jgi:hypothetical protein
MQELAVNDASEAAKLTAMNAERDKRKARYHEVKRWLFPASHAGVPGEHGSGIVIDEGAPSLEQLRAFDPADQAVWDGGWTPPAAASQK